jgi:hypothetical protein
MNNGIIDLMDNVTVIEEDEEVRPGSQLVKPADELIESGSSLAFYQDGEEADLYRARMAEIVQVVLSGAPRHTVTGWIRENYDTSYSVARSIYNDARAFIVDESRDLLQIALAEQILARRKLREESDDPMFILRVLDSEARVLGLGNILRIEHTGKGGGPIENVITAGSLKFIEHVG